MNIGIHTYKHTYTKKQAPPVAATKDELEARLLLYRGCQKGRRSTAGVMQTQQYRAKNTGSAGFYDSTWLGDAERQSLKKSRLVMLCAPKARRTKPGRIQTCLAVVPAVPLHAPGPKAQKMTGEPAEKELQTCEKSTCLYIHM